MRRSIIFLSLFAVGSFIVSFDVMSSNGIPQYSGSPGETNCTNCHFGSVINSGGGSIVIAGVPAVYTLSQTYTISVTVSQTGISLFGFDVEALTTTNSNAGTFIITNGAQMQLVTASNLRKNIIHRTNGGASSNSHTFTFNWKAPSTNVGAITFYATGNAANGNGNAVGDKIYSTNITSSAPSGIASYIQNYFGLTVFPDPVKEQFVVEYDLNESGWITADLFSLDGRKVMELINEKQDAGKQTRQFEISDKIPNGIYFINICADQKRSIRKILIDR